MAVCYTTSYCLQRDFAGRLQRRIYMTKKKIAESIIIRVGGGIREIPREPLETAESNESISRETVFEKTEDVSQFGAELEANTKAVSGKTINV